MTIHERDIEKHLVAHVQRMGGEIRKVQWIGRRGAPDRLVMLPDRYIGNIGARKFLPAATIWVELKAPGMAPEPHQSREHDRMRRVGQRVEVIDSIDAVEALIV